MPQTSEQAFRNQLPEYTQPDVTVELVDTGEYLDVRVIKAEAERLDRLETTGGWTPTAADMLLVQLAHLESQEPTWSRDLWLHTIEATMSEWADAVRHEWVTA